MGAAVQSCEAVSALQVRVRRRGVAAAAAAEAEADLAMLPEQAEQERARQLALQKALQLVMRLEDALILFSTNMVRHPITAFPDAEDTKLLDLAAGAAASSVSLSRKGGKCQA